MPIDYSKIPTEDLIALKNGDYKALSTNTLMYLSVTTKEDSKMVKPESAVPESTMGRLMTGIGAGMMHTAEGAKQRAMELGEMVGAVKPEDVQGYQTYINQMKIVDKPLMNTPAGAIGNFIGENAAVGTIPGGATGGLIRRMATGALSGAFTGYVQPTTEDESPIFNAAIGGAGGFAGAGLLGGISKGINIARGRPTDMLQELSNKFNIRLTAGEITRNPIVQKMETWLEGVPIIGIKGFRQKQQMEAESASKRFLAHYLADPTSATPMAANREFAGRQFENLKTFVRSIPDQKIEPNETRPIAKNLLDRYPDLFKQFQDTKTEGLIAGLARDLEDTVIPAKTTTSPILSTAGTPITSTTPQQTIPMTATFKEIWELRSGLGDMIGQARKKLVRGEVNETQLGQMKALFSAVNNDIDRWTASIGRQDVREAIDTANNAYKQFVVKYDVIQRAMDKATGEAKATQSGFQAHKFADGLTQIAYKDRILDRFRPDEIEEMKGLATILEAAKRSGQFMENPPTGNRWGLPVFAGVLGGLVSRGDMPGVLTAGGITTVTGLTTFLTSTKAGKRIALAASKFEPDSPGLNVIMRLIYQQAPKAGALGANKSLEREQVENFLNR